MRYAVLIIGLFLTVGLFFQSLTANVLSNAVDANDTASASAIGLLMALMWLVACGFVIPKPRISTGLFAVSALIGAAGWSDFPDLQIWSGIAVALAVMSYLGHRGKQKIDAKEHERDELMRQMVAYQAQAAGAGSGTTRIVQDAAFREGAAKPVALASGAYCPACGEPNSSQGRFCSSCGSPIE